MGKPIQLSGAKEGQSIFADAYMVLSRDFTKEAQGELVEIKRGTEKEIRRYISKRKKNGSIGQYAAVRAGDYWRLLVPKKPTLKSFALSGESSKEP